LLPNPRGLWSMGFMGEVGHSRFGSATRDRTVRLMRSGEGVFDRFLLMEVLGVGGMGEVWRAKDLLLGEEVALKILCREMRHDQTATEDLKEETRCSRLMTHPNVVRIHDFHQKGELAGISMELVRGKPISELGAERASGCLEVADVRGWIGELCGVMRFAHEEVMLVHRDLKPSNLLLNPSGTLKVADFGIAMNLRTEERLRNGGTLSYMSPQQLMGQRPCPSDDVYSLGATLYELLSGKPPFHPEEDLVLRIQEDIPPPVRERRAQLGVKGDPIPANWERAIAACLEKDPRRRPSSVRELEELLGVRDTEADGDVQVGTSLAGGSRRGFVTSICVGMASLMMLMLLTLEWRSGGRLDVPEASSSLPTPAGELQAAVVSPGLAGVSRFGDLRGAPNGFVIISIPGIEGTFTLVETSALAGDLLNRDEPLFLTGGQGDVGMVDAAEE